jgi:Plant transposon protein
MDAAEATKVIDYLLDTDPEELMQYVVLFVGLVIVLKQHIDIQLHQPNVGVEEETLETRQRTKRRRINWRWERAEQCVQEDYWGPAPLFNDRQFERIFRISRSIAGDILVELQRVEPFFRRNEIVARNGRSIAPEVKFLCALKMLAYGVAPTAFKDYFQMGESTMRTCFLKFCRTVSTNEVFRSIYLRSMSRADARNGSALHKEKHGVEGMVGSLDCMHIYWKNCPVAWQGQFKGKEESPSIVLEAFADFNLFIWHAAFGYAGTQNDINIWEQSPLLESWLDGSWATNVDFTFRIGDKEFSQLYLLVDGIYPEVSRFVKTISVPATNQEKSFAAWQEASRKDVERTFGVLQRKFHILCRKIELWSIKDISSVVFTCIILHNWMVTWRLSRDEEDGTTWYDRTDVEDDNEEAPTDEVLETVERARAEIQLHNELMGMFYEGTAVNMQLHLQQQHDALLPLRHQLMQKRWESLYNRDGFNELQLALREEITRNSQARDF